MSQQQVPVTGSYLPDDTTNPALVTGLLHGFLLSNGNHSPGNTIWKNTREEVSAVDARSPPWKRSAVWLLIRVAFQLAMSTKGAHSDGIYKRWMVFHMAQLLSAATAEGLSSDVIACMNAKLARRLVKLELQEHEDWLKDVAEHMKNAKNLLESRWREVIDARTQLLGFTRLAGPQVEEDTQFHLPELDSFLASITNRRLVDKGPAFCPKSQIPSFSPSELPAINSIEGSGTYKVQSLYAFEEWVSGNLDGWTQQNEKNPRTCSRIETVIQEYHEIAKVLYRDSAEGTSAMLMTILDLWVACDQSALAIHPLLSQFDHEIPIEPFRYLLLRFKSDMGRLFRAERYLKARSNNVTRRNERSAILAFGKDRCFSAEFAADSPTHQGILDRILEQAEETKRKKRDEFERLRTEYRALMKRCAQTTCIQHDRLDDVHENSDRSHSQACDRCMYEAEAGNLKITAYEWPLPSNKAERWSVIFELAVPPAFRAWRDISIFVLNDVLGYRSCRIVGARAQCTLDSFEGLSDHYEPKSSYKRVEVASETEPQNSSRQPIQMGADVAECDVCVVNEMHWKLFDTSTKRFLGHFAATNEVSKKCMIQLPPSSSSLQDFLRDTANEVKGPRSSRPNAIIAKRAACPEGMSIGEYKAICSLTYGHRTRWMNILVQLALPSVD